jgi:type VI secretion system secreted protein VgrG
MALPRLLSISSPLGEGVLIPTRLSVAEQLGLPYRIEVEVLATDDLQSASALLTKAITVTVAHQVDDELIERHFNGLVVELERVGPGAAGRTVYRLVAVPGLWRLGLRENCRIFQDQKVDAIVNAVLAEHDQPAPSWGILPALEPIPYCTQFNETDLHFVSRLLEEHGITFYFRHTASSHTLHLSATANGFPTHVRASAIATNNQPTYFNLTGWRRANRARSAFVLLDDMDGQRSQPSVKLQSSASTSKSADEPSMWPGGKVFHWPGGMSTRPGVESAKVAMGARETESEAFSASAKDPRFEPGAKLTIAVVTEDNNEDSAKYVVTAVQHQATDFSGLVAGAGSTETYAGSLNLVAVDRSWMPQPRHPRPVMAGLYSAKVVGPKGERIHVDEFGRIRVHFRWDWMGKKQQADYTMEDVASCWVRVAQAAAGAWGGTWFLPRVGDEVLVAFLDGDPDRPVVTGSVYGKDAKPPFLPGTNRAQSGIRTRSYKSDSADDANIFRFEDKKGSEEVLLHAQKDLKVEVENNEDRMVQNARTTTIKDSHDTLTVEKGNRQTTVKTGNDTHTVEKGNRETTVKTGNDTHILEKGNRVSAIKMGNETVTLEMGNQSHNLKMGNVSVKCDLGKITMEAMQSITLKVGPSTLEITPMGITLKGLMISHDAKGMHQTKAPMVMVDGSGMVMVKGGIVLIN